MKFQIKEINHIYNGKNSHFSSEINYLMTTGTTPNQNIFVSEIYEATNFDNIDLAIEAFQKSLDFSHASSKWKVKKIILCDNKAFISVSLWSKWNDSSCYFITPYDGGKYI